MALGVDVVTAGGGGGGADCLKKTGCGGGGISDFIIFIMCSIRYDFLYSAVRQLIFLQ